MAVTTGLRPEFVVEVLVDHPGVVGYGSGYLIGGDLVLTARHVVAGGAGVEVRFGAWDGDPARVVRADVTWRAVTVDFALLRLAAAPPFAAPPVRLGDVAPSAREVPFQAVGFPRHKQRERPGGSLLRDTDHVLGQIPALANLKLGWLDLLRDGRTLTLVS